MPLRNASYSDYPPNWFQVSIEIRAGRASHRCECTGECDQHRGARCNEVNKQPARWFHGRVILTVAHLCNCYPLCADKSHLKAMCQKCHLRTDRFRHAASRLRTQAKAGTKPQCFRNRAQALHFENLELLRTTPKKKRNRHFFPS